MSGTPQQIVLPCAILGTQGRRFLRSRRNPPNVDTIFVAIVCSDHQRLGVSWGPDTLLVALMAIGIESADKVIAMSSSFFVTTASLTRLDAKPVFINLEPATSTRPHGKLRLPLLNAPKHVPVPSLGQRVEMDPRMELAGRKQRSFPTSA